MPLISSSIPNLVNGVSQQPSSLRLVSQAELQVNGYSSVVEGLKKRPPTYHIAKLIDGQLAAAHLHLINRDVNERYVVVILDDELRAFGIDGTEKTVAFPNGKTYLNSATPEQDFRSVTVADYTFIVNKTIPVEMDGSDPSPAAVSQGMIYVKQGNYSIKHEVFVDGVSKASYTTSDTSISDIRTDNIAEQLKTQLVANLGAGWTVTREGSTVNIKKDNGTSFTLRATDSNGDRNLVVVKDSIQRFTDLPNVAPNGFKVEITGDPDAQEDNYFVEFETNGGVTFGRGIWLETIAPGITRTFDAATMPHILVRDPKTVNQTADTTNTSTSVTLSAPNANIFVGMDVSGTGIAAGTKVAAVSGTSLTLSAPATATGSGVTLTFSCFFIFQRGTWDKRAVGDEFLAPDPSFVSFKLSDIFFYRNRLGVLSDQNVILSRAGEFFNFWPTTVTAILDDDPIDVAVTQSGSNGVKVSILTHAVPFNKKLLLFSDQTQFILEGGDILTPKTVSVDQTTEFESSNKVKPVGAGRNLYFVVNKGSFSGVREYFVDSDNETNDAADITAHVPAYIPSNVYKLASATNEDIIIALTRDECECIYNYKYYWSGDEKLQSSWSVWKMGETGVVKVLNADFIDTDLYLVMQREDGVYLERMSVEPDRKDENIDYEVLLDRKITDEDCTVTYDSVANTTTWELPYEESGSMTVVTRDDGVTEQPQGQALTTTRPAANQIRAKGDWSNTPVHIGLKYEFRYRLSPAVLKEQTRAGGETVIGSGRIQVRRWTLVYDRTGYFKVEVTPRFNDTFSYMFTGRILGSGANVVGSPSLESGKFTFPVYSRADRVTIDIVSDSFLPVRIQSAEWEGMFVLRSQRT